MAGRDPFAEFIQQYISELQDLTFNSKALINTLTMLASENKQAAPGIAAAIERRILNCAPNHKLPALYLLDSIIKNVGLPYTALFARDLPEVYMSVWRSAPDSHMPLQKLYNTWGRFFPSDILESISNRVSTPQAPPQAAEPSTSYGSIYASSAQLSYPEHQGNSYNNNWLAQQHGQVYHDYGSLYPQIQQAYQQHPGMQFSQQAQQQQQQQMYGTGPAPAPAQAAFPLAYMPAYPQPAVQSGYSALATNSPQQHLSPGHAFQAGASPAYPAQQQQQQAASGQASSDLLSQLIGAGLIPAGRGHPQQPGGPALDPTAFDLTKSKESAAAAVRQLLERSEATKAAFLDQRLLRQQKKAANGSHSRQWFVRESDWLAGTTADAHAAPAFFDEPQKEEQKEADAEPSVPADPTQPICALSGERFESVWDDVTGSWRYVGATALSAEQAERYGLEEGALVKIGCLGLSGPSELEGATATLLEAEGQQTAEQLAAAAAEETRDPAEQVEEKVTLPEDWSEDRKRPAAEGKAGESKRVKLE